MTSKLKLTPIEQEQYIVTHLDLVKQVIYRHISVSKNTPGLEFDDLYQEGCIWLCHAAATYDPTKGEFRAFAWTVVKNGLLSYCRRISNRTKNLSTLSLDALINPDDCNSRTFMDILASQDNFIEYEIMEYLASLKPYYSNTIRLGLEALELKVKGYNGTEIAEMYGVNPNLVGARISRAVQALQKEGELTQAKIRDFVDKRVA